MTFQVRADGAFTAPVILTSNSDFLTPITGVTSGTVTVQYRKEGGSSLTDYSASLAGGNWQELGEGMYDVGFGASQADTIGSFAFVVTHASAMPYYGHLQVIVRTEQETHNAVTGIDVSLLPQIDNKIDVVTGQFSLRDLPDIYNAVTGSTSQADLPIVQLGAAYDGATLDLSLFLERQGQPVTSPISGEFHLYSEAGTELTSGTSASPDSQGLFTFDTNYTLVADSVPYVKAIVKDNQSRVTTITMIPTVR